MSYSLDLRKRVVEFVQAGGSKADSSRMFSVSLWCVNEWCKRYSLKPISPPGRPRNKLDWDALKKDIQDHPDRLLREHAKKYGVRINSIWHACKKWVLPTKKQQSIVNVAI